MPSTRLAALLLATVTALLPSHPALAHGAPAEAAPCTAGTGPYQRQLEAALKLTVDGRQSPADCVAIRTFQTRHTMGRRTGYADLATYRTLLVAQARTQPNAATVVLGPVPVRTGRDMQETRSGWHRISWCNRNHHSTLYHNAPMPYAQFFDRGQALHGHYGDLYDGAGSAGCVNLRLKDAKALWRLLTIGDQIYVWGTKPGTTG
ncbi:L,D-transpeptidase [Streptomyces sp. NPDC050085]|uniref:L,D-transpeptidase n=1 Tax=Streptomyces sp. NPDC050085 TaxID=3365600 RepID=UPI0037B2069F